MLITRKTGKNLPRSMSYPPFSIDEEPNEGNIRVWMDNIYGRFQSTTQPRWDQANIDSLFFAGEQSYINSYFNFVPNQNVRQFYFNFIQQPVNMITGYQRQHRKSINYLPVENSKQDYSDDLTKVITYANSYRGILEKMSTAYEQSAVSGMVLVQPYLDFSDDPVNGTMDLKIWPYNSFMIDDYYSEPDASDANVIWCQEYISKKVAMSKFKTRATEIANMSPYMSRDGRFCFLPENYNLSRNDLLVLSYIWFLSKRKKKMLYNQNDGICYEYHEDDQLLNELIENTGFFEVIEVEVPTRKLAVVLNDKLMYLGLNPLGFDETPLIPVIWNRDPHVSQPDLRCRSLVRTMRDAQFLLNRRVILNHSISEGSINTGYMMIENSLVNEEVLDSSTDGKKIIVKENGRSIQENLQKIIPNAVPPSDMQLADQLVDFIFKVSGVNQELLGMANDANAGIEIMLRQGAGLITLQKYFDQWDTSLKLLGKLEQKIVQNKWSAAKIGRILGKKPNPEFLNKTFSKYDVMVAEGLNTTIQQQQEFVQIMQLNQILGPGVLHPKFIVQKSTIQGKNEILEHIEQTQAHQAEAAKQQMQIEHAKLEAELQEIHARSVSHLATAKERHGRAEADIGLFEERISEISRNNALALKDKVDALQKLVETYQLHGQIQVEEKQRKLEEFESRQEMVEQSEKISAKITSDSNNFLMKLMQPNIMSPKQQSAAEV